MNPTPAQTADPYAQLKATQRAGWAYFGPQAAATTPCAARLVRFAGIHRDERVLDVACGTGVVSITAARTGAKVTGADLTPELLVQAKENAGIAGVDVEWREADVERLPFDDAVFDAVVSQFGHIFAPRPIIAIHEMLRVLKPGGTIAFSTWPADHWIGRAWALSARYLPPPPEGVAPPIQWGEPTIVRERLGSQVRDLTFDRDVMLTPALSPQHVRWNTERTSGAVIRLVESLSASDPARLEAFRREYDALVAEYLEGNVVRASYLMSRAIKT
ncbi:MAG TPA: class I SAM-dependent methyltransferase [Verrucomicrobiae bacterium]|nr:class I SAM-dependent methyltransferase [Verrucomicrobiae bacterium]